VRLRNYLEISNL